MNDDNILMDGVKNLLHLVTSVEIVEKQPIQTRCVFIGKISKYDDNTPQYDVALVSAENHYKVILCLGLKDFQRSFANLIQVMRMLNKNISRNVQKIINIIKKKFPNGGNRIFYENFNFMTTFL